MDIVTEEEKQALRSILTSFYGSQTLRWGVTQRSFELFGELISKTKQCDIAMNWVPRPFYIGNSLNWAKKQVRQAIVRHFKKDENKHYLLCMRASALSMKTQFFMAQN